MVRRLRRFPLFLAFVLAGGAGLLLYSLHDSGIGKRAPQAGQCRTCHNGEPLHGGTTDSLPYHTSGIPDALTTEGCLACHDGGAACDHSSGTLPGSRIDHPVGRQYPPPGGTRWFTPLASAEAAGAIFTDGRTGCLSCHNMSKPAPHLVRPAKDLCFVCHLF